MKNFRSLAVIVLSLAAGPALAQGTCTARDTPDRGADRGPPQALFRWCASEGRCGFVDRAGKWAVAPKFQDTIAQDGFLAAMFEDKWGFVDDKGHWLGQPQYDFDADDPPFGEGMAAVVVGEKWGYVDQAGKLVIEPQFDEALIFEEGLASVAKDDKRGYVDKTGAFVVEPKEKLDFLDGFEEGVAVVMRDDKYGLIDRTGAVLIEPKFDWLSDFDRRPAHCAAGRKVGRRGPHRARGS